MEDLLPVGSIVELKNKKRRMIIGYLPNKPNDKEFYDYICTNSVIGIVFEKDKLKVNKDFFYINADDIDKVLYIGCQDKEFDLYKVVHKKIKETLLEARKENRELSNEELENMYKKAFEDLFKEIENAKKNKEKGEKNEG